MSVRVRYKDIAVGADNNASVTTSGKMAFSDVSKIPYGVNPPAIATCELNGWGLSHQYKARGTQPIAFWSSTQSGDDCVFASPPTITLAFTEQYTTTGLTIQFAPESFDFCRKITVYWYQNETIKDTAEYTPESPDFVLNRTVEAFDKLVFVFNETNLPRKRCKIESILIGVVRDFYTKELTDLKAIHEIDLISNSVPINVLDASVHSTDEVDYIFQKKQPVEFTENNGDLIGVYFIDKGERTGRLDISFSCKDIIGLLDLVTYGGGLWLTDTPLTTVLSDVFGGAYEFDIDTAYANSTLRGCILPNKQREALRQIAFALGAVVDTTGTNKIRIFPPSFGTAEEIPAKETYTGGKVTTSDTVTEVTVTAYIISDEQPGDGDSSIELDGVKYKYYTETMHAYNPNTVTSDPENVKKFDKCYLVNLSNAQTIANNIMAYYQRRDTYSFKHILNGHQVSKRYTASLPWDGVTSGNIVKMTVTTSNITVSDTEMLLDE